MNANEDQIQEVPLRIINPKLYRISKYLKEAVDIYYLCQQEILKLLQTLNRALAVNSQDEKTILEEKLQGLQVEKKNKYSDLYTALDKFLDNFVKQGAEQLRTFIRFNTSFLQDQDDVKQMIELQSKEKGLCFLIDGVKLDVVVYKQNSEQLGFDMYVQNPDFQRKNTRNNNNQVNDVATIKEGVKQIEEQKQATIEQKQASMESYTLEPDGVSDFQILEVNYDSVRLQFRQPENNGEEIDQYRVCIVDYRNMPVDVQIYLDIPSEQQQTLILLLKFGEIKNIDYGQKILPFNKYINICIISHNKIGWSSIKNTPLWPIFIQKHLKTTLYMKGSMEHGIMVHDYMDENSQCLKSRKGKKDFSFAELCKFWLEQDNVRDVSLKNSALLINSNSIMCQWGQVLCFEDDRECSPEINENDFTILEQPYEVQLATPVYKVTAGVNFALCLTVTGQVYGWGANSRGQLGIGTITSHQSPQLLTYFSDRKIYVDDIRAGHSASAAKSNKGALYVWGERQLLIPGDQNLIPIKNAHEDIINLDCGQSLSIAHTPRQVNGLEVKQITAGYHHFGALTNEGALYVWGDNLYLSLGMKEYCNKELDNVLVPILLDLKMPIHEISFGSYHSLAKIRQNNVDHVLSWGSNEKGQCGQNSQEQVCSVGKVQGLPNKQISHIDAGFDHSLFLTQQNQLYGCGSNQFYQLTSDNDMQYDQATKLQGLPNIQKIIAGHQVTGLLVL